MKTARMTIMLDPAEKARIQTRARLQSVSTGEYVRRASQSYDRDGEMLDEATLEGLVTVVEENVRHMRDTLREATDFAQARLDEVAALRRERDGVR